MARDRELWLGSLTVVMTVGLLLLMAESTLRFLPVASGMRTVAVTAESPVFHFTPNRDYVYSIGWDLALANRGRVNNAGFVNAQNYQKDGETPLVAVIGDSYIEAAMVPYPETMHGRLAKAVDGKLRVYSFAASGAPLSQYVIWARHAVKDYGATALVINVVGNDFDESLAIYKAQPGFWLYAPDASQELRLRLSEYHPTAIGRMVTASALGRYLVFNLQLGRVWIELKSLLFGSPAVAQPRYAGNTSAAADSARITNSLAALDAFFRDLSDLVGLPPDRVLFVMDGARYPADAAAMRGTYFDVMRGAFRAKAELLGYEVIDLDPWFFSHHDQRGERFEYPRDGHWNSTGHAVAADAVLASQLLGSLINKIASKPMTPEHARPTSGSTE
jgi:hypothetical protein